MTIGEIFLTVLVSALAAAVTWLMLTVRGIQKHLELPELDGEQEAHEALKQQRIDTEAAKLAMPESTPRPSPRPRPAPPAHAWPNPWPPPVPADDSTQAMPTVDAKPGKHAI